MSFDFEKLDVYGCAKELNREILHFVKNNRHIDPYLRDQLRRASISIVINIAKGSGKFSKADKRNFYTIASVAKQSHFRLHSKEIATAYGLAMTKISGVS